MKLTLPNRSLDSVLRWICQTLVAAAVLLLGYSAFTFMEGRIFQVWEGRQLDEVLHRPQATPGTKGLASSVFANLAAQGLIGRLEIPRLDLSVIVAQGADPRTLRHAAGHIPGTALPGQPGNIGISAHRDTFFRPLRNIRENDLIIITTLLGEFRYRVVSTQIVSPDNVAVLRPSANEILTLVTCYPFYFIGSAPDRFIVHAKREPETVSLRSSGSNRSGLYKVVKHE